jgi:hypothetical protein
MIKVTGFLLLLLLLGSGKNLFSQQLSHQVLVPVAGVMLAGSINYSQTIGETAIEIISSSGFEFTQGFQQPRITFIPNIIPPGNGVDVYPNPAIDNVTVKLFGETSRDLRIDLLTVAGMVAISEKVSFTDKYYLEKVINIGHLNKGIYFIRIFSTDKIINRTFKIEKM